jgi:hypothetical protein
MYAEVILVAMDTYTIGKMFGTEAAAHRFVAEEVNQDGELRFDSFGVSNDGDCVMDLVTGETLVPDDRPLYVVAAQPSFDAPEVVSVFDGDRFRATPDEMEYYDSLSDRHATHILRQAIAKGARPTGDLTRELLGVS